MSQSYRQNGTDIVEHTFDWVSDSSGNATVVSGIPVSGQIGRVVIIPGSPAPTADYDVTLTDENGIDVLAGQGANLSATVTSRLCPSTPLKDGTTTSTVPTVVDGLLTMNITNAGSTKAGKLVVTVAGSVDVMLMFGVVPWLAMPSGALGIWYAADYDSTYKRIPNAVVSPSTNKLITRHPRGAFATAAVGGEGGSGGWISTGVTVTEKYAAGRDGVVAATRFVIASTGQARYRQSISLPAGTYTMVIDVKTTGAGPQDFLMSRDGGSTTVTKTATSTMQQFKNEFTLGSTTSVDLRFIATVAAAAGDFVIDKAFLWDGAAGTVPSDLPLTGDMYFGNSSKATVGIASGVIALTNGAIGSCDLPDFVTATETTIFAVVKRTVNYTGTPGFRYPFIWDVLEGSTSGYGMASWALGEYEGEGNLTGTFGGKRVQPASGGFSPDLYADGQYHVISMSANSAAVDLWIDDVELSVNAALTSTSRTARKFQIGNNVSTYGLVPFNMNSIAIYDRKLTDAERRVAVNLLIAKAQESGITITKPANYLIGGFDSITAGPASNSYLQKYLANITGGKIVRVQNEAIGGSTLHRNPTTYLNFDVRLPYHLAGIPALSSERIGRKFIVTLHPGANDLQPNYASTDEFLTALWIIADQLRARGAVVGIATTLPKGTAVSGYATHNSRRLVANAAYAAAVGTHCDFIIDFAADATMGPDAAANNVTYYSDGLHPTAAGHTILETIYRAAVNPLLV